jgi:integrase
MILDWLDKHLKGQPLHSITREVIDELRALRADETSKSTANRYMALLRSVLKRAAEDWGMLDVAPKVKLYQLEEPEPRWLTQLEAIRLRKQLPRHLRDMAIVAIYTGLRMRNITQLPWKNVDLERGYLRIPGRVAKGKKAIGVPLHPRAWAVIRSQAGKHEKVVFTYEGQPVNDCNTAAFKKAVKRAGVEPLKWHDLRHTFASWHAQSGTPLHVLQELGAWKSFEMVKKYMHLSTDHLQDYVRRLGQKPAHRKASK